MPTVARIRCAVSASEALLLGALLCVATVTGCDDGNTGSGGAGGSSGTTTGGGASTSGSTSATAETASAEAGTSTSDATSSTSMVDTSTSGATTGSSTAGTDDASTSSTGDTTGSAAVDVPFTVHDPSALELTARVPLGWVVITSAAQWAAFTDAPVPDGIIFPDQWVLFGSRGPQPFPGHALGVDTLTWQGGTLSVDGSQVEPAEDCDTYDFIWPADTLVSFDALAGMVEDVDDQTVVAEVSCAGGAGESMDCDLDTPCATGLLCAGIVRSTVLANSPGGLCLDSSYRGTFSGAAVTIPSGGATVEVSMNVTGLTSVDMDVTVLLDLDHPAPQELVIELRNPDGNEVSVANLQTGELHPGGVPIVPSGFSGDESVNGAWTLIARDTVDNANNGSVQGWQLEIMSRFD